MELNNNTDDPNIIDDMFIEIYKELEFTTILMLQICSNYYK